MERANVRASKCNLFNRSNGIPANCFAGRMEYYDQSLSSGYSRRDFYKISLLTKGEGTLYYADKTVQLNGHTLIFTNPMIPYGYESLHPVQEHGFFCLFTNEFINGQLRDMHLATSPLFRIGGAHTVVPDDRTAQFLIAVFERLTEEAESPEARPELLRAYIQLIMHEALKIDPPQKGIMNTGSAVRLADLFIDLLETQFLNLSPVDGPALKNALQYATQLSVHPNHLNRVLKASTGKSTTEHIAGRMMSEARSMLLRSSLNISEIAYSLGFNHASNFQTFFKRHSGQSANAFRKQNAANS